MPFPPAHEAILKTPAASRIEITKLRVFISAPWDAECLPNRVAGWVTSRIPLLLSGVLPNTSGSLDYAARFGNIYCLSAARAAEFAHNRLNMPIDGVWTALQALGHVFGSAIFN